MSRVIRIFFWGSLSSCEHGGRLFFCPIQSEKTNKKHPKLCWICGDWVNLLTQFRNRFSNSENSGAAALEPQKYSFRRYPGRPPQIGGLVISIFDSLSSELSVQNVQEKERPTMPGQLDELGDADAGAAGRPGS